MAPVATISAWRWRSPSSRWLVQRPTRRVSDCPILLDSGGEASSIDEEGLGMVPERCTGSTDERRQPAPRRGRKARRSAPPRRRSRQVPAGTTALSRPLRANARRKVTSTVVFLDHLAAPQRSKSASGLQLGVADHLVDGGLGGTLDLLCRTLPWCCVGGKQHGRARRQPPESAAAWCRVGASRALLCIGCAQGFSGRPLQIKHLASRLAGAANLDQ